MLGGLIKWRDEKAIQKVTNKYIEELQIRLTNIIRGLTTEEVIVTELIGNGMSKSKVLKKKPSLKDVIKACELLGRITGAYSNNNILNVVMPVYSGEDELE